MFALGFEHMEIGIISKYPIITWSKSEKLSVAMQARELSIKGSFVV